MGAEAEPPKAASPNESELSLSLPHETVEVTRVQSKAPIEARGAPNEKEVLRLGQARIFFNPTCPKNKEYL